MRHYEKEPSGNSGIKQYSNWSENFIASLGLNGRLEIAEERVTGSEDRLIEVMQANEQEKKRISKNEHCLRN
jgi:hypothetical protein